MFCGRKKTSVKPANVRRVGVSSENSIINNHANELLAHHGAVCGTIIEVTCMTGSDGVGVFDVCHDEVTSGHLITGCAVAQHCYNGDVSFLWEKWKL